MPSLTAARKAEIAAELRRYGRDWVAGPRSQKLYDLADEIEGRSEEDEPPPADEPSIEE
jgi:hypothetical protein